jgi:hypothetical protein
VKSTEELQGIFSKHFSKALFDKIHRLFKEKDSVTGMGSRDSSVGIAIGYGLDDRGSIPGRDKIFVSTPKPLDRL